MKPHCAEPSPKNIAAYRKAHKDTQAGLAEKLNYSDKSVSKWERGESVPDIYILTQIADLYGITVSNLIGEVEPPKASKPTYHMFILLLSVSLVFAIAAVLFSAFLIAEVPFRAWLFFVYAVPVSAIVCIVFTSLWWGIWQQGVSISVLIWSLGVCLYLSLPAAESVASVHRLRRASDPGAPVGAVPEVPQKIASLRLRPRAEALFVLFI